MTTDCPERQSRNQNRTAFGRVLVLGALVESRPVLVAALPINFWGSGQTERHQAGKTLL
jgi:hypothetical protein